MGARDVGSERKRTKCQLTRLLAVYYWPYNGVVRPPGGRYSAVHRVDRAAFTSLTVIVSSTTDFKHSSAFVC